MPEEETNNEDLEAQELLADAAESGSQGAKPEPDWKARAREWERRAKQNSDAARKLQELEDAKKSETERLGEQLTAAQQRALDADKLDVALEKAPEGMSMQQVRKLARRLSGASREEMETDAEELFAEFAPAKGGSPVDGQRPQERLTPVPLEGADNRKADEIDMDAWMRAKARDA